MSLQEVSEIALKWNISVRRVRILCEQKRIPGALKIGQRWLIPQCSIKPCDKRKKDDVLKQIMSYDFTFEFELAKSFLIAHKEALNLIKQECFIFNNNQFLALNFFNNLTQDNDDLSKENIMKKALDFEGLKAAFLMLNKSYQSKTKLTDDLIHSIYEKVSLCEGVKRILSLEEKATDLLAIEDLDYSTNNTFNSQLINKAFYYNIKLIKHDINNPYLVVLGILIMNYQLIINNLLPLKLNEKFISNYYNELQNSLNTQNYSSLIAIIKYHFLSYKMGIFNP